MCNSSQPLKVSQELIRTYTQRRNSHLCSASDDEGPDEECDPYAFEDGDDEVGVKEKKDKIGPEKESNKKQKVGPFKGVAILDFISAVRDIYFLYLGQWRTEF